MTLQCNIPASCSVSSDSDASMCTGQFGDGLTDIAQPLDTLSLWKMFVIFLMAKGLSAVCVCVCVSHSEVFIFEMTMLLNLPKRARGLFITLIFQLSLDI